MTSNEQDLRGASAPQDTAGFPSRRVVSIRVDATTYASAAERVVSWAEAGESRYLCAANVHMTMEAADDPAFADVVNSADLVTADGMPLVWVQKLLGLTDAERCSGPHLTPVVCRLAAERGVPIGVYGSTDGVLDELCGVLEAENPGLRIAYRLSPPFRPLSDEEDQQITRDIVASGARILLVGLGCPKQERWMHAHHGRVPAVMLGVGAAFDFLTGHIEQAPPLLQRYGLEWAYRLAKEPRRLWYRYAWNNPRFILRAVAQVLRFRVARDTGSVA